MHKEIIGGGSIEKVEFFQEQYGLQLEESYREFLKNYNGLIVTDADDMVLPGTDYSIKIDSLYGIGIEKRWLNIKTWMDLYADEIPKNSVIIGTDLLNGVLVLISSGENKGVYYWDSAFNFPGSSENSNAYYIAASFSDFIGRLGGLQ